MLFATLFSAQRFVVAELFTQVACATCLPARSALRSLADDRANYPYLIPLIWQLDTYPSPNGRERSQFYNALGVPWVMWGGSATSMGVSNVNTYITHYNTISNTPSPIEIDLNFDIDGLTLTATANIKHVSDIGNLENPRIVFVITYNRDIPQPGDYFASVVRYAEHVFNPSTTEYRQTFTLDGWWDHGKTTIIALVQNFGGDREILNASARRLFDNHPPANLQAFSASNRVALSWDAVSTFQPVLGYNVYRNGERLNLFPIAETNFIDFSVVAGTTYEYYVTTVYQNFESEIVNTIEITPVAREERFIQLGGGISVTENTDASPINISQRSLRSQFVFTRDNLTLAGLPRNAEITHMGFYVEEAPVHTLPNYRIRLKHTTASSINNHDSGPWVSDNNIGNYNPIEGDWDMIELNNPFVWNGTNNILIDTAFSLAETADDSGTIRVAPVQRGYRFSRSDLANQINAGTTLVVDYKPQLMIYFDAATTYPMQPPFDLTAKSHGNAVLLSWRVDPIEPDPFLFQGFRIYRDGFVVNATPIRYESFLDTNVTEHSTYTYKVTAVYLEGESAPSNDASIIFVSDTDETVPLGNSRLIGNFPNPFNPETSIRFEVRGSRFVQIEVFNIRGQRVRTLLDGTREFPAGEHSVIWNGRDDSGMQVSSGIYFYQMRAGEYQSVRKMILLK